MFANIKEDKEAVGNKLLKWISVLAYLNSALMVLLIILARPLILFLYGERWSASTESFQILCFGGLFLALQDINYYVIAAFGASRKLFVNNFYALVVIYGLWGVTSLLTFWPALMKIVRIQATGRWSYVRLFSIVYMHI